MDEYKSNSHKSREKETDTVPDKKIRPVVTGGAKARKKNEIQKLIGVFLPEDVSNVKSYILFDIIIPLIKKALSDTVDALLYPGEGRGKKGFATRISYSDRFDRGFERRNYSASSSGYSYDDYVIPSRGEAEEVLMRMDELVGKYSVVSVADFYDLVGVTGKYTDNKYGWTDIRNARVTPVRDGYVIKLPRALPLD